MLMKHRHRHRVPPDVRLGKRADGGAGEAAAPMIVHVRSQLVASEPIDLVFFDTVEDHLVAERNAVGRTRVGAFTANFAEVIDADIHGRVGNERQVG